MIGRERETARLRELIGPDGATAQVVGPPGMGKSTLARAALEGAPALWVSLEPVEPEHLLSAVAAAARVPADAHAVRAALAEGATLVLDGAEGVLDAVGPLLEGLRSGLPALRVLITTQRRLSRIPALELGPLAEAEAVRLFVERARATSHQVDLAGEEAAVVELVRRLEGWPLAVELAASRVRLYSPAEILEEGALAPLADPSRRDRHGSLARALEASWNRLSPPDRAALARAALFRGGFDRRAFREVSGADVDTLERLIDASLVRWTAVPSGRRHHLLAAVRAFALARLEPDDPAHARWAEAVAARGREAAAYEFGSQAAASIQDLVSWSADLQAVSRMRGSGVPVAASAHAAIALAVLAKARGPIPTAIAGLAAIPRESLPDDLRREVDLVQADQLIRAQDPAPALELIARWPESARTLWLAGLAHLYRHVIPDAMDALRRAVERAEADRDPHTAVNARLAIGVAHLRRDELREASAVFERGLRDVVALDRPDLEGLMLKFSALVDRDLGVSHEARVHRLERAVALHQRTGAERLEAMATSMLALALADAQDPRAEAMIQECLRLARRTAEPATPQQVGALLAMRAVDAGDHEHVRQYAATARGPSGDAWTRAWGAALEGLSLHHQGSGAEADAALTSAIADFDRLGLKGDGWTFTVARCLIRRDAPPPPPDNLPPGAPKRVIHDIAALVAAGSAIPEPLAELARGRVETRLMLGLVRTGGGVTVAADGSWFRTADGALVDLSRKRVLKRVLAALAPGEPLTWEELLERGWPGERTTGESGRARVHVAVADLRKLGLRDALITGAGAEGASYALRARIG